MRPFQDSDRRVRVLRALAGCPDGLRLVEILAALDQGGRRSQKASVVMLKGMRGAGVVAYEPAAPELRTGGVYTITPAGWDWLARHGFLPAEGAPAPVLTTGAMQGEVRQVLRTVARAGQAPANPLVSVFHLGRQGPERA